MRAIRFHRYGDTDVLALEEAPEPHADAGQVRIRVLAAGVNPADAKVRAGLLRELRPSTFPAIPGMDAVGVVDEVGEGATGVSVGDRVFGLGTDGTTAEFAVLEAWAPVPSTWSIEQAAAAALVAQTATLVLDTIGDVAGRTVLIEGAAGGVGSTIVEFAIARGAAVVGTSSPARHDFLRSLGAEPTTYGEGLAERVAALAPDGVHAAFDMVGSGSLAELVAIVGDASRVVTIADFGSSALGVKFVGGNTNAPANLAAAAVLGEKGVYTPRVSAVFPIERTAEAHGQIQTGHTQGKLVVTVGGPAEADRAAPADDGR